MFSTDFTQIHHRISIYTRYSLMKCISYLIRLQSWNYSLNHRLQESMLCYSHENNIDLIEYLHQSLRVTGCVVRWPIVFLKNTYSFIWLCWTLVAACRIFSCGMQTLSCGMWDLVPWSGSEPGPPALGAQSLSNWTTREVPKYFKRNSFFLNSRSQEWASNIQ